MHHFWWVIQDNYSVAQKEIKGAAMSGRVRFKGQVQTYIQWPIRMSILVVIFNIGMYFVSTKAGMITSVFALNDAPFLVGHSGITSCISYSQSYYI